MIKQIRQLDANQSTAKQHFLRISQHYKYNNSTNFTLVILVSEINISREKSN